MFIRHGPLSGSTVSTIPATEAELDAVSQVTPPPKKDKKDKKEKKDRSKDDSAPKEALTKRPRSPTVHYSPPQAPTKESEPKLTAVKAKAAPTKKANAAATKTKSGASKPAKVSSKVETPDQSTAKAMQSTLQRASTVDLKTTVAAAPEPHDDTDDGSSQESEGEEEAPEGVTVEQLRERKRLHARYMRFSRSLKSSLAAYTTCICTHSHAVHVSNIFQWLCIKHAWSASCFADFCSMNKTCAALLNIIWIAVCFHLVKFLGDWQFRKHQKNESKHVCTSRHFWKEMIHWFSHLPITCVVPRLGRKAPREIRLAGEAAYRSDLTNIIKLDGSWWIRSSSYFGILVTWLLHALFGFTLAPCLLRPRAQSCSFS